MLFIRKIFSKYDIFILEFVLLPFLKKLNYKPISKVKNDLVSAHTFFYLASIIENRVDIGYHLIIEDEFSISEAEANKSKEAAKYCMEVGLEICEFLAE